MRQVRRLALGLFTSSGLTVATLATSVEKNRKLKFVTDHDANGSAADGGAPGGDQPYQW